MLCAAGGEQGKDSSSRHGHGKSGVSPLRHQIDWAAREKVKDPPDGIVIVQVTQVREEGALDYSALVTHLLEHQCKRIAAHIGAPPLASCCALS